jgi:hypothetical protein
MQEAYGKFMAYVKSLRENGQYVDGDQLAPVGKYLTGNPPVASDGPFAESKEVVGGYFKIRAGSLEEAIEIAKPCPGFLYGGRIEVRPTVG